jgi:deoxyribonuclease-4
MLIGAHISASGGYPKAVEYATSVGAECLQLFAKSPRQWRGPAIDTDAAARFRDLRGQAGLGPLFTHTAYLINISTEDDVLWEKSVDALADEIARGIALGATGVVSHIGNDRTQDPERAAGRAASAVCRALERCGASEHDTRLLLENTAGAGTTFGSTFEQLAAVIDASGVAADTLGICLDTCHAHAFGIALDSSEGWEAAIADLDRHVGIDRLGLIHANDCMFEAGSHRDRHAWIGDGTIGIAGFSAMLCAPALQSVCAVTEMPGEAPYKDEENLRRLRLLRQECGV